MLLINPTLIHGVKSSKKLPDLFMYLQKAIELEHSTIPPYLTAMISIKPGSNKEINDVIHSVVIEEMLHMSIAANILNAIGGAPVINKPGFIPVYPGPLPMGINASLIVHLERFSKDVVHRTFMEIEEPENPLNFPERFKAMNLDVEEFATIGQFYEAIKEMIIALAPYVLPGDPGKQMTTPMFESDELFPIITKEDAIKAIDVIIEQGEGTPDTPLTPEGEIAHYYRFKEIYLGKKLVYDPASEKGWYYGPPIPFDEKAIFPISKDTKIADLPDGTQDEKEIKKMAEEFSYFYTKLLHGLHRTFNGEPGFINNTMGLMYDIKLIGQKLAATPFPGRPGETVGTPFEFSNVFAGSVTK
ncbi:MAG TPA: ferritin-like protein [Chitinophaga sp.]|uniref:ferritin-like domain-containing protein n=1 Tax=Chitinophaga sp. TaxID=1869181 RepID=UPI002BB67CDA|nr:ferritin-like protein [Chitinophaga sp.]HVI48139.1 ferritin-like protein [Chitinophaga sp.]